MSDDLIDLSCISGKIKNSKAAAEILTVSDECELNVRIRNTGHCHNGNHIVVKEGLDTGPVACAAVCAYEIRRSNI